MDKSLLERELLRADHSSIVNRQSSIPLRGLQREILAVEGVVEPANHHLFPGLRPPADFLGWIGIVGVLCRVVMVGRAFQATSLRRRQWFLQKVTDLPVKVVAWN